MIVRILLASSVLLSTSCVSATTYEEMRNLQQLLFTNYSSLLRPSLNYSEPTVVGIKVTITDVIEMNEVQGYMKVLCIFTLEWTDDFLAWQEGEHGGITKMQVESHDIWKPYLSLYSSLGEINIFGDERYRLTVYSNGSVVWKPSLELTVVCDMKVQKFPFDTQTCNLTFAPLHYTEDEILLTILNDSGSHYRPVKSQSGWELEEPSYMISTSGSGNDRVSVMRVVVKLSRQYLFFMLNFLIPIIILSFLNLLTFWIPNDSGEKVSFSTTVLLSLTVFLTTVGGSLPQNGKELVLIVLYIALLLVLSCMTVFTTIVLLFFHHKRKIREERKRNQVTDLTKEETRCMKVVKKMKYVWRKLMCTSDYDSKSGCTVDVFLFLVFFSSWCSLNFWYFSLVRNTSVREDWLTITSY